MPYEIVSPKLIETAEEQTRYIELLEKVNQQLSHSIGPYNTTIAVFSVLFALLAIVAALFIAYLGWDYKRNTREIFANAKKEFDNFFDKSKQETDRKNAEQKADNEAYKKALDDRLGATEQKLQNAEGILKKARDVAKMTPEVEIAKQEKIIDDLKQEVASIRAQSEIKNFGVSEVYRKPILEMPWMQKKCWKCGYNFDLLMDGFSGFSSSAASHNLLYSGAVRYPGVYEEGKKCPNCGETTYV